MEFMIIISGILLGCAVSQFIAIYNLKADKEIAETQLKENKAHFEIYRRCADSNIRFLNERIQSEIMKNAELYRIVMEVNEKERENLFKYTGGNRNIPQGTVEAVKYAMKHAHPDNGGDAEDFMKFQKVYKELMGK